MKKYIKPDSIEIKFNSDDICTIPLVSGGGGGSQPTIGNGSQILSREDNYFSRGSSYSVWEEEEEEEENGNY